MKAADDISQGIYVITTSRDTYASRGPDDRPIVFEQYIDIATLEHAREFKAGLGNKYGKVRIAKLVFIDEEKL